MRRNATYGLRVAKNPSSLMSFCSPSYFPANDCCFACVSFQISVLPSIPCTSSFVPHFPSQNSVEHARSKSLLQRNSFYITLSFSPMYFLSLLHFLTPYFPSFPYFPGLSRTSSSKILLSMPASDPSSSIYFLSFPSRTFLCCGFYL